ncbi:sigma-E factor regulatory protein RseB, partial [Vibrio cholerae]|nr:sigma-E factor regulatory protein RseB [Vibrio cholerae]
MKRLMISALTLLCVNSTTAFAEEESAEVLLYQMDEASKHLYYVLSYNLVKKNSIEPL